MYHTYILDCTAQLLLNAEAGVLLFPQEQTILHTEYGIQHMCGNI